MISFCRGPFFRSTADQIRKSRNSLKAQSPLDPVVHDNKNIKRNGFQPSIRPKPKKKPSPFKISNSCLPKQHQQIQKYFKKREGKLPRESSIFPPLLVRNSRQMRRNLSQGSKQVSKHHYC
jgi:hypothetical protein